MAVEVEYVPVAEVRPYGNNPRFNDGAVEGVRRSIERYGFLQPIVVDADGVIIAGHTRYKAALEMGLAEVPCIRAAGLSEDEARAYRLADNKVADASFWDNQKLLEELPYCAETERGVEIIRGHHRVRAAKDAGLESIPVLLDRSGLGRSEIAAKQLAHNSLEGEDDPKVLRQIAALITDVDGMLESGLDESFFEAPESDPVPGMTLEFKPEYRTVQFLFLPGQLEDLQALAAETGGADWTGVARADQWDGYVEALSKTRKFGDCVAVSAAIDLMVQTALRRFGGGDGEAKTLTSVFGRGAIDADTCDRTRRIIRRLQDEGRIGEPWEVFDLLVEQLDG